MSSARRMYTATSTLPVLRTAGPGQIDGEKTDEGTQKPATFVTRSTQTAFPE